MSKHTPGPWLHRAKSDSVHRPPPYHPYQFGDSIFRFHDEQSPSDADLALILAAPDLLEALKLAVRQNEHDMLMTGDELRDARAAIAKATGEQA
jgi:hypothetical protein